MLHTALEDMSQAMYCGFDTPDEFLLLLD